MESVKVNKTIRPVLRQMNIGDIEMFPIERSPEVRNTCSRLTLSNKLVFKTRQLNVLELIEVTRIN
jgi:hypothetical protein